MEDVVRAGRLRGRSYALARRAKRALDPPLAVVGRPLADLVEAALRRSSRRAGIALVYHSIDEERGDPVRELVPAHGRALFEAQVRYVRQRYDVVSGDKLLPAALARKPGERFPLAITFDDDLACHPRLVAPALQSEGLTATFFLTGASLAEPFTFWWERLQQAVDAGLDVELGGADDGPSGAGTIHELGRTVMRMTPAERDRFSARLAEQVGEDSDADDLDAEGVRALVAAGMSVGFHTRRHDPMAWLEDEALDRALREGRDELEAVTGLPLATIAYPHGHVDRRVASAAREAGFVYGFTTRVEPVAPTTDPLLIGRMTPSYRSVGHFALQLVAVLRAAHR